MLEISEIALMSRQAVSLNNSASILHITTTMMKYVVYTFKNSFTFELLTYLYNSLLLNLQDGFFAWCWVSSAGSGTYVAYGI